MINRKMRGKGLGLAAAAGLLLAPAAYASNVDVYYVPDSTFEIEGGGVDAEFNSDGGYGAKGQFHINSELFISAEYQKVDYDEIEVDGLGTASVDASLEGIRGGLGFHLFGESPIYVLGEYIRQELELDDEKDDQEGYGVHLGARDVLPGGFGYYLQAGYADVGDNGDGFEGLAGATFNFTEWLAVFADYRYTNLKSDDDAELTLGDIRVGARFLF